MSFSLFFELFITMFRDPRGVSGRVLALNWPLRAVFDALALVTVFGIFALKLVEALSTRTSQMTVLGFTIDSAIGMGVGQGLVLVLGAWLIARIGRQFGGGGDFRGALTLTTWLQACLLTLQLFQILLLLAMPPLAVLVSLATLGLIVWWFAAAIAELHGFRNLIQVAVGMLLCSLAMLFVLAFVFAFMGVSIQLGVAKQ